MLLNTAFNGAIPDVDALARQLQSVSPTVLPPAAAGYRRIAPGLCIAESRVSLIGFNGAADNVLRNQALGGMTLIPASPPPASATAIIISLDCKICASNSANVLHEFNAGIYNNHAGVQQRDNLAFAAYEFIAVANTTWIGGGQVTVIAPVTGPNLEVTMKFTDTGGSPNSQVQGAQICGYFDTGY